MGHASARRTGSAIWGLALTGLVSLVGCASRPPTLRCAPGQSAADGQCVPTATLVFARCIDAFRKTAVEQSSGKQTRVAANANGYGGAEVEHQNQDSVRAEYSGIPDELLPEALAECRRQEQQEREGQLERAWAAADAEKRRADAAEQAASEAAASASASARDAERLAEALQASKDAIAQLELGLAEAEGQLDDARERFAERHPCEAQAWDRCAEAGHAAERSGDDVRARALLSAACDGGQAPACTAAGKLLEQGRGGLTDLDAAYAHYAAACEADDPDACARQGEMALQGRGTVTDLGLAATLLRQACADDEPRACGRLGTMIERGVAEPKSKRELPKRLYAGACDGGYARGCLWLGDHVRRGSLEREPDPHGAAEAYERACEGDEPEGCLRLAEAYEVGDGVPEDPARARRLAQEACEQGLSRACASVRRFATSDRPYSDL